MCGVCYDAHLSAPQYVDHVVTPIVIDSAPKGRKTCEHGKRKSQCKECGGTGICEHGRHTASGRASARAVLQRLLVVRRNQLFRRP
jgi:hypothetical protein